MHFFTDSQKLMSHPRGLILLALLVCVAAAGCGTRPAETAPAQTAPAAGQTSADPDHLRSREQQRVDYLVAGDFDRLEAMLSPTLSYTHSNATLDDRAAFLNGLRSRQVIYRSMTHRDVQVRFVAPGVAILNGLSDAVVNIAGQDQDVPLRFTIVYVQKDGEWLMEAWHSVRRPA